MQTMYEELEAALGYTFCHKAFLRTALTHSSYAHENTGLKLPCNERMEFLGDSVLGFAVADYLYRSFPDRPEGEMTKMRADMVCEVTLSQAAQSIDLGNALLVSRGEEHGGGRKRASVLADAMEAVIAAAYLDGGWEAAYGIIERLILTKTPVQEMHNQDYKTALQELIQRQRGQTLEYRFVGESGPDHSKRFCMEVVHNGRVIGTGEGSSKKRAEQEAARVALKELNA